MNKEKVNKSSKTRSNRLLYKSVNSCFGPPKPLVYVTREDDDDSDDKVQFEENNNVYDSNQESEHRNYRDFLGNLNVFK